MLQELGISIRDFVQWEQVPGKVSKAFKSKSFALFRTAKGTVAMFEDRLSNTEKASIQNELERRWKEKEAQRTTNETLGF